MTQPQISELERALAVALREGDREQCVAILRQAPLALPISEGMADGSEPLAWACEKDSEGKTGILAFTSVELMTEATRGAYTRARVSALAHMAAGWPDNTWFVAINPGTPLSFEMESGYVGRLVCPELAMQPYATPEMPVPIVQKALRPSELATVLAASDHRVSGFVHKSADAALYPTPGALLPALGVEDSTDWLTETGDLYLLRWFALGNDIYRVPIGGRDADQCAASAGWVIEPAPFVGLGMAPHPDSLVAEYKVNAVVLPYAAEIGVFAADGSYRRHAVLDSDRGRWMLIVRTDDLGLDDDEYDALVELQDREIDRLFSDE